jgi:hypothetical protein
MDVLGIEVTEARLRSWAAWLAPDPQPFLVGDPSAWDVGEVSTGTITKELRDTYCLWRVERGTPVVWLSEAQFAALPRRRRAALVREQVRRGRGAVPTVRAWQEHLGADRLRSQADGHRFVWWPSLVSPAVLARQVSWRRLASRHAEVDESTWRTCGGVLPGARGLAGTFPRGSDACCFSTVMAAAGADVAGACDSVEPFDAWLATACRPGGDADRPGAVLVWRRRADGTPLHAAVSIGDGWVLEKPSQEWHSPVGVAAAADVVRAARMVGQRLERHTINGG